MDTTAIFTVISKGLDLLPVLLQAGVSAYTTLANLKKLSDAGAAGTSVSDSDLAVIEAQFDADLAKFNEPMPDPVVPPATPTT